MKTKEYFQKLLKAGELTELCRKARSRDKSAIVLGVSGAGMSFAAKVDMINSLRSDQNIIIIDPKSEYISMKADREKRYGVKVHRIMERRKSQEPSTKCREKGKSYA